MVKVGDTAPDFTAPCYWGCDFKDFRLSSLKGKWVILFFYPADFTFVCPTELEGFAKNYDRARSLDAEVVAISTDSEHSHRAWAKSEPRVGGITFPWVADKNLRISRAYDVLMEDKGMALRGTFIIDPEGVIKYQVVSDPSVGRSVEETFRVLQALQSGGLCPIEWKPGQPNIRKN